MSRAGIFATLQPGPCITSHIQPVTSVKFATRTSTYP